MRHQDRFIIAQRNRFDRCNYIPFFIVTYDGRYAHRLFQTSEARIVIIQRGDVIRARLIQRELCIQDIQVDADAGTVTDARDLVRFPRLLYRLRGGLNPFLRAADIQVGLRHIQFDLAARLQVRFFRRGEIRFSAFYFSYSGAAVIERPAHAAGDFPVFIFKAREIFVLPAHVRRQRDSRFIAGFRDI